MAWGKFNPRQPRDSKGRWTRGGGGGRSNRAITAGNKSRELQRVLPPGPSGKKKGIKLPGTGHVTVRAGLSSATVMYGRTLPLIPGRVNVHLGVHARVEKAGGGPNFLEKRVDSAINRIAARLPQKAGDVLKGKKTDIGGITIGAGKRRRVNPQIRVTNKKKTSGRKVRKPRQARQPRQPRQRGASQ